jgi:hypothetical protein
MKLSVFRTFLAKSYERLFTRRFELENECEMNVRERKQQQRPRRFDRAGAIFPTESILPRYQY